MAEDDLRGAERPVGWRWGVIRKAIRASPYLPGICVMQGECVDRACGREVFMPFLLYCDACQKRARARLGMAESLESQVRDCRTFSSTVL